MPTYLKKAETSITIAMYFIILEPVGEGPINELVNDIVDAKNRGVQVKIVLEDSKLKANRLAYEKLKENNNWAVSSLRIATQVEKNNETMYPYSKEVREYACKEDV